MNEQKNKPSGEKNYLYDLEQFPSNITAITATLRESLNKPDLKIYAPKEQSGYKGEVIYADKEYVLQAVGAQKNSVIVHKRDNISLVPNLEEREKNNDLVKRNIQVHYTDLESKGKTYPWDAEKEAEKKAIDKASREAEASKVPAPSNEAKGLYSRDDIMKAIEVYAIENITNTNQRNAFLKHTSKALEPAHIQEVQKSPSLQSPDIGNKDAGKAKLQENEAER